MREPEVITVADAARALGVGRSKINAMIREGTIQIVGVNPIDKRQRLVLRADIEALLRRIPKETAA